MQKIVIKLGLLAVILLTALPAVAQRATVRDFNAIPQSQIDALNAGGENLTEDDILANIFDQSIVGTDVTFEAVILTDPRNSGLSNVTDGRVDRVHMFVRDTSAASMGPEGMNIQVVDGAYDTNNLLNFTVGDVIQINGTVSPFGTAMQVSPNTITLLGDYLSLGLPDTILDPVTITTDEANSAVGLDGVQVNWNNLASLRNQYVRVEDATITTRSLANPDRPDFYISNDEGTTVLNFYDTGLRFRNDRQASYPMEFNIREDDFEPGPPGSVINLQGVLIFQGGADQIGRGVPGSGLLSIAPFEERGCDIESSTLFCDYELLESPPVITDVTGPDFVPDGSAPVSITFVAQADPTRTLTSTTCEYFTSEDAMVQSVTAMQSGDNLACSIPAQSDEVFVTYQVVAEDNTGAVSESDYATYRTLVDGIDSISDIQQTADEGPGDSPFVGITTAMNISATVNSRPETSGIITIQDDLNNLSPWSGVFLAESGSPLVSGDEITITEATITESFGVTTLTDVVYTVDGNNGFGRTFKIVNTTILQDDAIAEAHEGMSLIFNGNVAGPNPDAPRDFGEWSFATTGTEDFLRADDASAGIPSDFNASLPEGTAIEQIAGIWWFSFGNYKLVPEGDFDVVIGGGIDRLTVRDFNAIPQSQIDALIAGGENLTEDDILANIFDQSIVGTDVTFDAVILTDPRNSGLSNVTDGRVDRVHMFVRDVAAAQLGPEGMGIQVVDGAYDTNNLLNFTVGDVIQINGTVSPFGTAMQVSPNTITLLGDWQSEGLPESILEPITITTDEANSAVGVDGVQVNWANLADLRNAYVRVEDATITTRSLANPDRPDFYISNDDGETVLNFYDTGLRFRNDRQASYPMEFNIREDDFEPGPPGSLINLQGVLIFQGGADQIGRGVPASGLLSIAPFEERGCEVESPTLFCDYELLESPPIITDVTGPDFVPDGSAPVSISFFAQADPTRTLTSTTCEYFTSEDAMVQSIDGALSGDDFVCEIPAQGDEVFVTYQVVAEDNTGAVSESDYASYRTLVDGIDSISDIQQTADEGPGDSPFVGITTAMSISATVNSRPETSGIITIQDDLNNLSAWSGVFLAESGSPLVSGDEITITEATITESFGVTTLTDVVYTVDSNNGFGRTFKIVNTSILQDDAIAEAHEGMSLIFENVVAGPNPDDPRDFGEWSFASESTEDFLRADDASADIPSDFNASLPEGTPIESIAGIWWFSFGNYKLVPEGAFDVVIGMDTATEDGETPLTFALDQNYPNPFNPTTTIAYSVPVSGSVTIEVFDLLGRSVSTLVDGTINAGQHTVEFDASNLPSGMYLYRLTAGEKVETRKMMLLK